MFGSEGAHFCSGGGQRFLETDGVDPHRSEKVKRIVVSAYNTEFPGKFQIEQVGIKIVR